MQYRGRVKGNEANNACLVAYLYTSRSSYRKGSGILGAVRARLIDTLVTDEETAASCLRLVEAV